MKSEILYKFYKDYCGERHIKLTEDQFVTFAVFFPTIQVIISDGVIDMEEWEYVNQLSRFMAKSFKDKGSNEDIHELSKIYLNEISYLIRFLRIWQDKFIDGLKQYSLENPEVKNSIVDTMQLFAEASGGTSEEEQIKMDNIKTALDIA